MKKLEKYKNNLLKENDNNNHVKRSSLSENKLNRNKENKNNYFLFIFQIDSTQDVDLGFPGGSVGRESACKAGDLRSIPRLGRSPRVRNGNPCQFSCLENSVNRGARQATVYEVSKIRTQLSNTHTQDIKSTKQDKFCDSLVEYTLYSGKISNICQQTAKFNMYMCDHFAILILQLMLRI